MLDPKSKNCFVDYSDLLQPPKGFILKRAVGTTYSLDLQALLAVPVAMFYSKPLETDFEKNDSPLDVFDAISKASKIVTIFCQKGKIQVPRKFNKLICFTEDCVHEISPINRYSSFHPKCWWLWFENPLTCEKAVRFCITSRNLSFDRCWDVSFSFDGLVTSDIQRENKSMVDMLNYLNSQSGNIIEPVYKSQLSKTVFENDLKIKSWKFHPIGISKKYNNPLADKYFRPDVLLMMSPFIQEKYIMEIAGKSTEKCWLFSRKCELQKIAPEAFEYLKESYCIPDIVVNGEFTDNRADEIPNADPDYLDLHAKLYVSRKGNTNTWFLGSANLTSPAFTRNIECLIELKTDENYYRPESIFKELVTTDKENKLFEEFFPDDKKTAPDQDKLESIIRNIIYDTTCSVLSGVLVPDDAKIYYTYNMRLDATLLQIPKDFKVFMRPWSTETVADHGLKIKTGKVNELYFDHPLKLSQVSKYFVFTITCKGEKQKEFLVKAEIEIDNEQRQGKILAEIIDSKEKFLQYLRFLLSNSGIADEMEIVHQNTNKSESNLPSEAIWNKYNLPLYEELLKSASQQPQKLRSINDLITKLKSEENTKDFISPELSELWNIFKKVIK